MMLTYMFLLLAIVFEVGWAVAMKLSQGLTRPGATAAMIAMYLLSVVFLALAVKKMDVGVAYALWAGAGVAVIATIGMTYFREPASALKLASIGLILVGIVGLQLAGGGTHPSVCGGAGVVNAKVAKSAKAGRDSTQRTPRATKVTER